VKKDEDDEEIVERGRLSCPSILVKENGIKKSNANEDNINKDDTED
jgi:hypothetical protein